MKFYNAPAISRKDKAYAAYLIGNASRNLDDRPGHGHGRWVRTRDPAGPERARPTPTSSASARTSLAMFGRAKPITIRVFAKTDLGKTRDHNEDNYLVADLSQARHHRARRRARVRAGRARPAARRGRRHGRRRRGRARERDGHRHDLQAADRLVAARTGGHGPALRVAAQGGGRDREPGDPQLRQGPPREPRHGHDRDLGRHPGRAPLPHPGGRQPRLPGARRRGPPADQGPVPDAAPRRGGRAHRRGSGAERAPQHHPAGARPRREGQGRPHPPGDPPRRRAGALLRRPLGTGQEGGDRARSRARRRTSSPCATV